MSGAVNNGSSGNYGYWYINESSMSSFMEGNAPLVANRTGINATTWNSVPYYHTNIEGTCNMSGQVRGSGWYCNKNAYTSGGKSWSSWQACTIHGYPYVAKDGNNFIMAIAHNFNVPTESGQVCLSTNNGVTWSSQYCPAGPFSRPYKATIAGSTRYYIYGTEGLYYTTTGMPNLNPTWTKIDVPSGDYISEMIEYNGRLVAFGLGGKVSISENGTTFISASYPSYTFVNSPSSGLYYTSVGTVMIQESGSDVIEISDTDVKILPLYGDDGIVGINNIGELTAGDTFNEITTKINASTDVTTLKNAMKDILTSWG